MQIRVKIDTPSQFAPDIKNPTFKVFWQNKDLFYPMEDWEDFGFIIIGWWVSTIIRYSQGDMKGDFLFMDGPYSIGGKLNKENGELELSPKGLDIIWRMSLEEFTKMLVCTIQDLQSELSRHDIQSQEHMKLETYLKILKNYSPG